MEIKHIKNYIKLSLLDWPSKMAGVIFMGGCNFKCDYCHNPDLVLYPNKFPDIPIDQILEELRKSKDYLDGVVITGGEPLLYDDTLQLIQIIKQELGYPVKIDTNGSMPERLELLIHNNHIDYIAMDFKYDLFKYSAVANVPIDILKINSSRYMIINSEIDYEFRLTVCPMLHHFQDICHIANSLNGAKKLVLQQFNPRNCLNPEWSNYKSYGREVLEKMKEICEGYVNECIIRGI